MGRTAYLKRKSLLKERQHRQRCILLVDGFNRERPNDKVTVFHHGQLFVPFLVLMAGVADARGPFFTTVWEPSL